MREGPWCLSKHLLFRVLKRPENLRFVVVGRVVRKKTCIKSAKGGHVGDSIG